MARMCPYCGVVLPDGLDFCCLRCGRPVSQVENQYIESERMPAQTFGADITTPVSEDENLVYVGRFNSPEEAELARVYLEAEGIEATNAGGAEGVDYIYRGVPLGTMLAVRKSDAQRAAQLLKIAALRIKEDPALPLNRVFSAMVSGAVILFVLILILVLLGPMFGFF